LSSKQAEKEIVVMFKVHFTNDHVKDGFYLNQGHFFLDKMHRRPRFYLLNNIYHPFIREDTGLILPPIEDSDHREWVDQFMLFPIGIICFPDTHANFPCYKAQDNAYAMFDIWYRCPKIEAYPSRVRASVEKYAQEEMVDKLIDYIIEKDKELVDDEENDASVILCKF